MSQSSDKVCIIGAGPAGLTMGRQLQRQEIPFEILERFDEVGGIWHYRNPRSPVYRSAHLISSKRLSEFREFPMPANYPDYPNRELAFRYLCDYARHFNLYPAIEFGCEVSRVERDDERWRVMLTNGEVRHYRSVVLATGHEWYPSIPSFPGEFTGEIIHSSAYRDGDQFEKKRVLIVGAGNSGCDIACDSVSRSAKTFLSLRRGYYIIPKYFFGKPADEFAEVSHRLRLPLFLRRWINTFLLNHFVGRPENFGLPKPDHRLLESHPIVNSHLFQALGQGDIVVKADIRSMSGREVTFVDGTVEEIDLIVYATGYEFPFPFIDRHHLNWGEFGPRLYLHLFNPDYDNFAVLGLIKPDSGVWWMIEEQAQAVAQLFESARRGGQGLRELRNRAYTDRAPLGGGIDYVKSSRHYFEVEHFGYSARVRRLVSLLTRANASAALRQ